MTRSKARRGGLGPGIVLGLLAVVHGPVKAQVRPPPVGREAALALRVGELAFKAPRVETRTLGSGVPVLLLEDHTLPLVTVLARFQGGYALLPRELYAAATALPSLMRAGGTRTLAPDSVNHLLDFYALQLTFGGGGRSTFSSVNTLTKHLPGALRLWEDLLRFPRFDSLEVEVWRGRQREVVRRREEDPGQLAVVEFNRLMFGDHPVGWVMEDADLTPDRFSRQALVSVHRRIICPEHLVLGVVGDVVWPEVEPLLEELTDDWPACSGTLEEPPPPRLRRQGGVFLIPRSLPQSTVVMASPGGVRQSDDPDYFASRIANSILGGSGFSSRLLTRVRTEEGYAYSASSLWTTPGRYEGIVGATTKTRGETTVAATRLILDIMEEMRGSPPSESEVERAVLQIVNGFVFNFQDPAQIVSRRMYYQSEGLPPDWLERYLSGIQRVTPEAVHQVLRRYLHPERMTILVVGDPETFDPPLDVLGEVKILHPARGP